MKSLNRKSPQPQNPSKKSWYMKSYQVLLQMSIDQKGWDHLVDDGEGNLDKSRFTSSILGEFQVNAQNQVRAVAGYICVPSGPFYCTIPAYGGWFGNFVEGLETGEFVTLCSFEAFFAARRHVPVLPVSSPPLHAGKFLPRRILPISKLPSSGILPDFEESPHFSMDLWPFAP